LHHGWNQIGNPTLDTLYWPFPRQSREYQQFKTKGLWEYSSSAGNFVESDSLIPWRGYYVYRYPKTDTTVTFSAHPFNPLTQRKSGAETRVNLSMGWGPSSILRLGADLASDDSLNSEDEFSLPMRNAGLFMHAQRQSHSLASDWVRLKPAGIQEWKVALGGTGDSLPPVRILAQAMPDGFEAWAVSPARRMKFKLDAGTEIPASGLAYDTLMIYSGPREKLSAFGRLKDMALVASPLDLKVAARDGGFALQLTLPSKAKIRALVWGVDGSRKGELVLGPLSQGYYRFSWDGDFHKGRSRMAPGMYFLTVDVQGPGLNTRLVRKLPLSN
jgi:hypothetical protein